VRGAVPTVLGLLAALMLTGGPLAAYWVSRKG